MGEGLTGAVGVSRGGVTWSSKVSGAARPQIRKSTFSSLGDVKLNKRYSAVIAYRGRRLSDRLSDF